MAHRVRNPEILKAFGENLKRLREEKGMTQEDLADKANIAVSSIGRIEIGRLNTSVSTIVVLADALGVDKKEIMDF